MTNRNFALQLQPALIPPCCWPLAADSCSRETGLFKAVASMRPGERAWVYITDHKYGYGEKGSFSFPSVPPACQLVYDVTMVTCEPPDEVRNMCTASGVVRGVLGRSLGRNKMHAAARHK